MTNFAWESEREAYARRVKMLADKMGIQLLIPERDELLDRLCDVVGDPVTGPDLLVVVALFKRELIGRRRRENAEI